MLDRFEDIRGSGRAGKFDRLDRFNRRLAGSRKARLGFQVSTSISRDARVHTRACARARVLRTSEIEGKSDGVGEIIGRSEGRRVGWRRMGDS